MRCNSIILLAAVFIAASSIAASAQSGCTDPAANNYNASATLNDGSCTYAATHYNPVLRAAFGAGIPESSGLVFSDGKLWTHNDSGNPAQIFSVDTVTGAILQTVYVDNFSNTDWEDIAADSANIYIGNFGNNNGTRTDLKILKIAKADITIAPVIHVNAQAINFSYTDQTSFASSNSHNFDCESLISIRDSLYIFTKDRGDLRTRVYKMPKTPGTYAVSPYTSFNAGGLVTGADYNSTTKEIVLVGYLSGHTSSFLWFLNGYKSDSFFTGNKRRVEIGNGVEWQTEGVCWLPNNRFFISCEMTNNIPASFYVGNRSLAQPTGISNTEQQAQQMAYPNPVKNELHLDGLTEDARYRISSASGQAVRQGLLKSPNAIIAAGSLPAGAYTLSLYGTNGRLLRNLPFIKE